MTKHTHCKRCRRRLKDPRSIKAGIGSTCLKKLKLNGEQQMFNFENLNDVLTDSEKESESIKI